MTTFKGAQLQATCTRWGGPPPGSYFDVAIKHRQPSHNMHPCADKTCKCTMTVTGVAMMVQIMTQLVTPSTGSCGHGS